MQPPGSLLATTGTVGAVAIGGGDATISGASASSISLCSETSCSSSGGTLASLSFRAARWKWKVAASRSRGPFAAPSAKPS